MGTAGWRRSRRAAVTSGVVAAVLAGSVIGLPPVAAAAPPAAEPAPESVVSTGPFGLQVSDMASARSVAAQEGEPVEVIAKRTESSSTWVLPDGNLSTSFAAGPVWVRLGGDGTQAQDWALVDLTLQATADGTVRPKAHPGDLVLAGAGTPDDGRLLSMSRSAGEALGLAWDGALPGPELDGPRATYRQVQPGVDLVVEATRTGYEQFFVLTEAPDGGTAPELSLTVQTEGLTAAPAADGAVTFTDADGTAVAASGTPQAWDAAVDGERLHPLTEPWTEQIDAAAVLAPGGAAANDAAPATAPGAEDAEPPAGIYSDGSAATDLGQEGTPAEVQAKASPLLPLTEAAEVTAEGTVEFTLTPDAAYLTDPDTQYPVVVDPDVTLDGWFDTWVQSNISATDQSGSSELRIGTYDSGGTVARSFLNVDMGSLKYRDVLNADFFLWNWHSWSCTSRGWEVWATGTASTATRWSSQPTWVDRWGYSTQTRGYSSSCAAGWVAADVTDLIQAWSDNGRDVVGLGVKANNEANNEGWKKFNSGNYSGGGLPHINVTYAAPPPPATGPSTEVALPESLAPILRGTATAPGTGAESMQFYARTASASTWDLLNGISVAGRDAYRSLPAGQLEIGEDFVYLVKHCDDGGCTSSASKTGHVSPDLGAGSRPGATRIPFTIGDKIAAQVDVGTGNLYVTTQELSLRRVTGSLDLGLAYNGLTLADGSRFTSDISPGWRFSTGSDIKLVASVNGRRVFYGPNGLTGTFTFDSANSTASVNKYVAPKTIKATLQQDIPSGNLALEMHDSGDTYRFTSAGRLYAIEDRKGNDTTFTYGSGGELTKIEAEVGTPAARTATISADPTSGRINGLSQSPSGAAARSVQYQYTGGRLTGIVDVLGRTTSFGYNTAGDLDSITPPGAPATTFTYDAHRVTKVTQPSDATPGQAVTRFQYLTDETLMADPNTDQSQAVAVVPNTNYHLLNDGRQLVDKTTDPSGAVREKTYTTFSDVQSSTDASGAETTFGYNPAINDGESLTSMKAPTDTDVSATFGYGNTGAGQYLPSEGTDAQGVTTTYETSTGTFDGATNTASGATAEVARTSNGTIDTSTSPRGAVTDYTNDATTLELNRIDPPAGTSLGSRTYTYDPYGRVRTYTSGRNITETYTYDAADRVTRVEYGDGSTPDVTYVYDAAGRVETRTDASGITTYSYDPLGRLKTRQHTAGGGLLTYEYDLVGNLVAETDGAGQTTHTYDGRNLLTSTATPDGRTIRYAYDSDARRTDTWFATNTDNTTWAAHTYTDYDDSGRITRLYTARNSDDTARVSDLEYSYTSPGPTASCASASVAGDTGLRWSKTDHVAGNTTSYCYEANRLTRAATSGGDTWTYTYDVNGNRKTVAKNGTTVQNFTNAFNPGDQLSGTDWSYDGAGNLNKQSDGMTFSYTGSNQLKTATPTGYASGSAGTYTFAGTTQNEMISQTLPGGAQYDYTWGRTDRNDLPLLESFTNPSGTTYLWHDDGGSPLAMRTSSGSIAYYALDGLGSPVALVNSSGVHIASYSYDPYGEITASNLTGNAATDLNPYGFTGGLKDRATGWVKLGQRFYDVSNGRFTQQDSLEVLADPTRGNRYEYVRSNPVNYVDPTGMDINWCAFAIVGLAISLGGLGFAGAAIAAEGLTIAATGGAYFAVFGTLWSAIGISSAC